MPPKELVGGSVVEHFGPILPRRIEMMPAGGSLFDFYSIVFTHRSVGCVEMHLCSMSLSGPGIVRLCCRKSWSGPGSWGSCHKLVPGPARLLGTWLSLRCF